MCKQPRPSLNETVINMFEGGACVHQISKLLGVHLARVKGAITHHLAEKDQAKKANPQINMDFSKLEERVLAYMLSQDPDLTSAVQFSATGHWGMPYPQLQQIPTKPRMSPTEYLEVARAYAAEQIAKKQAELNQLRSIPQKSYIEAQPSYSDLAELVLLTLDEMNKRHGKSPAKT